MYFCFDLKKEITDVKFVAKVAKLFTRKAINRSFDNDYLDSGFECTDYRFEESAGYDLDGVGGYNCPSVWCDYNNSDACFSFRIVAPIEDETVGDFCGWADINAYDNSNQTDENKCKIIFKEVKKIIDEISEKEM